MPTFYNSLYVQGLGRYCGESWVLDKFSVFGRIIRVVCPINKFGGFQGHCYVEFANKDDAERAKISMDNASVDGCTLNVSFTKASDAYRKKRDDDAYYNMPTRFFLQTHHPVPISPQPQ